MHTEMKETKNGSRVLPLLVLALVVFLTGCETPATVPPVATDVELRTISVRGVGQAAAVPDQATMIVGVETEAEIAEDALAENSAQMQSVIDALLNEGIAEEDLQTRRVSLRPRYQEVRPEEGPPVREIVGYTASNTVEVTVRDLEPLGELLDIAIRAGGNRIQSVRFELSDPTELMGEAREAAWIDAREKAEQLVGLAGAQLGPVQSIDEQTRTPRPVQEVAVEAEAADAVPVQPGTESVEVELMISWLIVE